MENSFENLEVWKLSHQLVLSLYKLTKSFPKEEQFRLGDQIRRSVSSVATNIVEGNSRGHKKEYIQFLYLSKGSLDETKYHLLLSKDLGYITTTQYDNLQDQCNSVGKMLNGLVKYLKSKI